LARAVIGGLSISTMLTLFLIPTLYLMLEERFPRRRSPEEPATTETELIAAPPAQPTEYPAQ